ILYFIIMIHSSTVFYIYFFFYTYPSTIDIYTLSLHDALPIYNRQFYDESMIEELDKIDAYAEQALFYARSSYVEKDYVLKKISRSEEHTSELQSRFDLVCRLLLEKKNK